MGLRLETTPSSLELEIMRIDTVAQSESGLEVSDHDTVLLHLSEDSGVDSLLLSDELSREGSLKTQYRRHHRINIPSSQSERRTQLRTSYRPSWRPWSS